MILARGRTAPTPAQIAAVSEVATADFNTSIPLDAADLPAPSQYIVDDADAGNALCVQMVPPHVDEYYYGAAPRNWRALFWVMDTPSGDPVWLPVGTVVLLVLGPKRCKAEWVGCGWSFLGGDWIGNPGADGATYLPVNLAGGA